MSKAKQIVLALNMSAQQQRLRATGNINSYRGPKGDPFTYEDFTPEQLAALVGPVGPVGPEGAQGKDGNDGQTPYIGSNGNWWIGDTDTGTKAQGPAGPAVGIDDTAPSSTTTYSSQKIEEELTQLNEAMVNVDLEQAEDAGDVVLINADLLGGMTLAQIILMMYPVGAIYTSTVATSPATLFGGTWESIGGRFLLAANSTYPAGSTGGEAEVSLTDPAQNAPHKHSVGVCMDSFAGSVWALGDNVRESITYLDSYVTESGEGAPHNNMPPYLAVYMWQRIA